MSVLYKPPVAAGKITSQKDGTCWSSFYVHAATWRIQNVGGHSTPPPSARLIHSRERATVCAAETLSKLLFLFKKYNFQITAMHVRIQACVGLCICVYCVCVCMYVCMYEFMYYVCMYEFMYVCIYMYV